jgi:hypothetical protein
MINLSGKASANKSLHFLPVKLLRMTSWTTQKTFLQDKELTFEYRAAHLVDKVDKFRLHREKFVIIYTSFRY